MLNDSQKALIGSYKRCFATEDGATVLKDLRANSTMDRTATTAGRIKTKDLIWHEAQRSVILYILRKIAYDLDVKQQIAITKEQD
jgi:hypothetical protein